jgi:hypothetical protein
MTKAISINTLGNNGRWGNQLFQYCFAKAFAQKYNLPLKVPSDWCGRKIFQIEDPVCDNAYSVRTPLDYIPTDKDISEASQDIDLFGYWQFQESIDHFSKKWILDNLRLNSKYSYAFLKRGIYVAAHKRRGDYVSTYLNRYCSISDASYDKTISDLFDDQSIFAYFVTEENPLRDSQCESDGIGFFADFSFLANADMLIRSNSTFGWWAGVFCEINKGKVYSPLVEDKVGWNDVEFVLGNWPRMSDSRIHIGSKLTDLHLKV